MKTYNSFKEVELDLKRLKLERQIGLEQLKGIKGEFSENLKPMNWVGTALNVAGKYGLFMMFKKFFR